MKRPFGITIIAIVAIIAGILGLLASFVMFAGLGLLGSGAASAVGAVHLSQGLGVGLALLELILSSLYIVFGIGAMQLNPWAWGLGVALSILSVLEAGVNIAARGSLDIGNTLTVIGAVLILVYLYVPRVRKAFGRG
jgi:hypothetical protein